MGKVILDAWKKECRLDSWSEHFNKELWRSSLGKTGINMANGGGGMKPGSPLPWGHLDFGVDESYLISEREKAYKGEFTSDCSEECHNCGPYAPLCASLKKSSISLISQESEDLKLAVANGTHGRKKRYVHVRTNPTGVLGTRIRVKFGKNGMSRFTGHLDMVRIFDRTLRRSDIPVMYTQGFHPHAKISFGPSLPLGLKSTAEYADFSLSTVFPNLEEALKKGFPEGFSLIDICSIPDKSKSLNEAIKFAEYHVRCEIDDTITKKIITILESNSIPFERWTKRGMKKVDIRPGIVEIKISDDRNGFTMLLSFEREKSAKPMEVLELIFGYNMPEDITRTEQYVELNGKRIAPLEVVGKI